MTTSKSCCESSNPFNNYLPAHTLICAEAARLTSHLAIVMAHAMGNPGLGRGEDRRGQQSAAIREDATRLLIAGLEARVLDLDLGSSMCDYAGQGLAKTAWRAYIDAWKHEHDGKATGLYSAVFLPLDGAASLCQGRAGTMTWCAISRAKAFSKFADLSEGSYLVLAIGPSVLTEERLTLAHALAGTVATNETMTLNEFLRTSPSIRSIGAANQLLVAHTLELPHFRQARPFLGTYALGRWLDGSAIVAALAAFTQRTDLGYCICRREALPVIAATARSAGGVALAVPVAVPRTARASLVTVKASSRFFDVCALLEPDAHVVCVGASVTEICASDRVRWSEPPWQTPHHVGGSADDSSQFITVHTLLLDTMTRMYEERVTGWDLSKVQSFGGKSLRGLVGEHQSRWKADYEAFAASPSQPDDLPAPTPGTSGSLSGRSPTQAAMQELKPPTRADRKSAPAKQGTSPRRK